MISKKQLKDNMALAELSKATGYKYSDLKQCLSILADVELVILVAEICKVSDIDLIALATKVHKLTTKK